MKNDDTIFATFLAGTLITIIALIKYINLPWFLTHYLDDKLLHILFFYVILDFLVIGMVISLRGAISGWVNKKSRFAHINIRKCPKLLLSSILFTFSVNIIDLANVLLFNTPLNRSIKATWLTFLIISLTYLFFATLIVLQKPKLKNTD